MMAMERVTKSLPVPFVVGVKWIHNGLQPPQVVTAAMTTHDPRPHHPPISFLA